MSPESFFSRFSAKEERPNPAVGALFFGHGIHELREVVGLQVAESLERPYARLRSMSFCRVSLDMFSEDSLDILRLNLGVDSIIDYHDRSKGARSYTAHSL